MKGQKLFILFLFISQLVYSQKINEKKFFAQPKFQEQPQKSSAQISGATFTIEREITSLNEYSLADKNAFEFEKTRVSESEDIKIQIKTVFSAVPAEITKTKECQRSSLNFDFYLTKSIQTLPLFIKNRGLLI